MNERNQTLANLIKYNQDSRHDLLLELIEQVTAALNSAEHQIQMMKIKGDH